VTLIRDWEMVGESVLIDRLAHSAEGYRLGANIRIHHRWQLEDLHGGRIDLDCASPMAMSGRHLMGQVGLVVGVELPSGAPAIGHISGSCRAEVTLARRRVLSAWSK
jgi:hypothetical protein